MNIRITEEIDAAHEGATLHLEGTLGREEAELVNEYCGNLRRRGIANITLDVAGLTFIEPESAAVICRLRRAGDVRLSGCRLFTREIIENAAGE